MVEIKWSNYLQGHKTSPEEAHSPYESLVKRVYFSEKMLKNMTLCTLLKATIGRLLNGEERTMTAFGTAG